MFHSPSAYCIKFCFELMAILKKIYIHYKINNLYDNITFCLLKILKGYSIKIFLI